MSFPLEFSLRDGLGDLPFLYKGLSVSCLSHSRGKLSLAFKAHCGAEMDPLCHDPLLLYDTEDVFCVSPSKCRSLGSGPQWH